jgi:hypothetical protein
MFDPMTRECKKMPRALPTVSASQGDRIRRSGRCQESKRRILQIIRTLLQECRTLSDLLVLTLWNCKKAHFLRKQLYAPGKR